MTFGREKRLLLGGVALLAPLPLPLNDVVGWPSLALFWAATLLFLRRAWLDTGGWLPNWAMNLLALAYLPVLFVDVTSLWRGRILQPVVHLLLFTLVVKLFSLRRERDKWHVLLVVFFVFLAAAGSSVHPSVIVYVLAFLGASLLLLARFVSYEMLSRHARRAPQAESVPLARFVTGGVLFAVVIAVPLFVFMPRLRSPYVVGPGGGYGDLAQVASFEEVMRLDGIGRVRGSRQVVMRLGYDSPPPPSHQARIKVMTYDRFENDQWSRRRRAVDSGSLVALSRQPDGYYPLGRGEVASWMEIWMQPFARSGSRSGLALPVDGLELDLIPTALEDFVTGATGSRVLYDDAGVGRLPLPRQGMVRYRIGLGARPGLVTTSPLMSAVSLADSAGGSIGADIGELASEVMGEGSVMDRVRRVESYLSRSFEYTLDLMGTPEGERIESFLFETQRGHCELFASAMVLMLRAQGVPARLATGFLGADFNPIEGYYIVRQSNAHAWVEAYIEDVGWLVFDPTPPAGRPAAAETGLAELAAQLYDFLIFRWDRYVLTFGLADQVGVLASVRDLWQSVASWFSFGGERSPAQVATPAAEPAPIAVDGEHAVSEPGPASWWPLTLALLTAIVGFYLFQRRRFSATRAYLRLRERLRPELGAELESAPPLAVVRRYVARYPHTAEATEQLLELYLAESFESRVLLPEETQRARELLRLALKRKAA